MKKVFLVIGAAAIIMVVAVHVQLGLKGEGGSISNLTLENIVALGQYTGGESNDGAILGGIYFLNCTSGSLTTCKNGTVTTVQCKK